MAWKNFFKKASETNARQSPNQISICQKCLSLVLETDQTWSNINARDISNCCKWEILPFHLVWEMWEILFSSYMNYIYMYILGKW